MICNPTSWATSLAQLVEQGPVVTESNAISEQSQCFLAVCLTCIHVHVHVQCMPFLVLSLSCTVYMNHHVHSTLPITERKRAEKKERKKERPHAKTKYGLQQPQWLRKIHVHLYMYTCTLLLPYMYMYIIASLHVHVHAHYWFLHSLQMPNIQTLMHSCFTTSSFPLSHSFSLCPPPFSKSVLTQLVSAHSSGFAALSQINMDKVNTLPPSLLFPSVPPSLLPSFPPSLPPSLLFSLCPSFPPSLFLPPLLPSYIHPSFPPSLLLFLLTSLLPTHPLQSPNVGEFMNAVLGIHSHYHQLVRDIFSSHKEFYSALDRVRAPHHTVEECSLRENRLSL